MSLKKRVPPQYHRHLRVFSDEELKKLPPERPWDHAIDLKEGAPATLISKNIRLSQTEQVELRKFIKEHLARGTICPSKSPYAAAFFIRKKGWKTPTGTRLPTHQRLDHSKQIPPTFDTTTNRLPQRTHPVHQTRHSLGIQCGPSKEGP